MTLKTIVVSCDNIVYERFSLARFHKHQNKFHHIIKWYQKGKRHRHSVTLHTRTTLAQRPPEDLEQQTVKFHRFVITSRQRHGYSLSRIFNMDETPMRFELPPVALLNSAMIAYSFFTLARLISKYIPI